MHETRFFIKTSMIKWRNEHDNLFPVVVIGFGLARLQWLFLYVKQQTSRRAYNQYDEFDKSSNLKAYCIVNITNLFTEKKRNNRICRKKWDKCQTESIQLQFVCVWVLLVKQNFEESIIEPIISKCFQCTGSDNRARTNWLIELKIEPAHKHIISVRHI